MTIHDAEKATPLEQTSSPEVSRSEPPPAMTAPPRPEPLRVRRRYTIGFAVVLLLGAVSAGGGHAASQGAGVREWYDHLVASRSAKIAWDDAAASIPVSSRDPSWGHRDALVTIVMFSDFQCPYCEHVEATMTKIREAYGPEKVRIVWKNQPLVFHQNAKAAAEAAQGVFALAGSKAFWKFHDLAFAYQTQLTAENFVTWAGQAGLKDADMGAFKSGVAAHTWAPKVDEDEALGTKSGVRGTPAVFINGAMTWGAQSYDGFAAVVDQELAKAQQREAAGADRAHLYVALSQDNAKSEAAAAQADVSTAPEMDTTVHYVPLDGAPALGGPDASVTIVVFSDYECPFCKKAETTLQQVRATYGKKVRIVWRDEPLELHARALPAARLAREARTEKGDRGFWAAHDRLFASAPALEDADLRKIGASLRLDPQKVSAALSAGAYDGSIAQDKMLGDELKVDGTPTFFVNGHRLVGVQTLAGFKSVVDEEITKADALRAKGVTDVYAALSNPLGAAAANE